MNTKTCSDCDFWEQRMRPHHKQGQCRRRSPTWTSSYSGEEELRRWPLTFDNDWCGEGKWSPDLSRVIK